MLIEDKNFVIRQPVIIVFKNSGNIHTTFKQLIGRQSSSRNRPAEIGDLVSARDCSKIVDIVEYHIVGA